MNSRCPVCFYQPLPWPAEDHNICICCGVEFGFDDFDFTYEELRTRWLQAGGPWFSSEYPPPSGWSATKQLLNVGYGFKNVAASLAISKSEKITLPGLFLTLSLYSQAKA